MVGKARLLVLGFTTALCILTLCVSFMGNATPAQAASHDSAQSQTGKAVGSAVISRQRASQAKTYWTPQRMKTARPADLLLKATKQEGNSKYQRGTPKKVAAVAPRNRHATTVQTKTGTAITPNDYSYPFPFVRYEVGADYTQWPYSPIGKVFFTDSRTGGNFVCSGSAVTSNNQSLVETAGHCVIEGGSGNNWYTNWMFCPAYKDGICQLGVWYARQLWSWSDWIDNGRFEFDLGEAVMYPDYYGNTLVSYVGGQGIAWNYDRNQYYSALGYPAADPFNGQRLIECDAPYATSDNPDGFWGLFGPYATGIGCDMTGGSSGGPWLIYFSSYGGYINGHNDYKYDSQPLAMYSPYYGNEAETLYLTAENA